MPADDRDTKFERALAHHLHSGPGPAGCPDAETLAAYHERSMSLEEMAHWKQHIAGCAACQEALALVEATEKQLAEEWQGDDVPVLEAAAPQPRARFMAASREDDQVEEIAADAAAPVEIAKRRRPPLLRWALPVGAVAAGVLVWIGIHEQRALQLEKLESVQVAQNVPAAAPPENRANTVVPNAAPPAERDTRQAQLDLAVQNKKGESVESEAARTDLTAPAAKPAAREKNMEAAKKESEDHLAGRLASKTAPPSARASAQPSAPASATETVEVTGAPPAPAQTTVPAPSSNLAAGATGGMAGHAEAKSAAPSAKDKVALQSQAADNLDTNAMMMKQGLKREAMQTAAVNASLILTPDQKVWWRLGAAGNVELTTDGGAHWKTLNTGTSNQLTAGFAPSSNVCWIAGKGGTLLLTTDRGAHWNKIVSPIAGDLGGVHASDEKHASIWDASNRLAFETSDGGATWVQTANE